MKALYSGNKDRETILLSTIKYIYIQIMLFIGYGGGPKP